MGFLDGLLGNGWDDPKSQAIIALAAGRNMPQGLLMANQAFMQARAAQEDAEDRKANRGLLGMRMKEYESKIAQENAERERQANIQRGLPSLLRPPGMTGGEPVPQSFAGTDIPMFSQPMGASPVRQTPGGFDMQRALTEMRMTPAEAKAYAAAFEYGTPEVARVEETMVNGRPVKVQLDKRGNVIGNPLDQWKAPQFQSLGNRVGVLDPITGQERSSIQMGIDPGTIYSGNITMRGQNMADARARETANQGKWQYDAQRGGLVNMQTGEFKPATQGGQPVETKASREAAKEDLMKKSAIAGADSVLKEVKDAKGLVGWNTAGLGGVSQIIPATEGRDLSAKLQTIKANLGFDRLQQMRQESPTGGALGQVAVQELAALQATVASLDQLQSPAQLGAALDKIEQHYTNWRNVMNQARNPQGGATGSWDPQKEQRYQQWKRSQGQ